MFSILALDRIRVIENVRRFSESYAMLRNIFKGLLIVLFKSHVAILNRISRMHGHAWHLFAVAALGGC